MNCPNCNSPLSPNQRFCGTCGFDVSSAQPLDVPKTTAADNYTPEQTYAPQDNYYPQEQQNYGYQQDQGYAPQDYGYQQDQGYAQQNYGYQQDQGYAPQDYGYQQDQGYAQQNYGQQNTAVQYQPHSNNDYSQQYSNYQQQSPYGSTNYSYSGQSAGGSGMNKKTLTIIIAVVAVLAVAGIVLGIVFGVKSCSGDKHTVKAFGVEVAKDDKIDTTDGNAKSKIEAYLEEKKFNDYLDSARSSLNGEGTLESAVYGNTWVWAVKVTREMSESEKSQMKSGYISSMIPVSISQMRSAANVDNLVVVVAVLDKDNNVLDKKVMS